MVRQAGVVLGAASAAIVVGWLVAAPPTGCSGGDGCSSHAECDDGVWCNGAESCGRSGRCFQAPLGPCDDGLRCNRDECDEAADRCLHTPVDGDGDTQLDVRCGGADCDDENAAVHPGAEELCDGLDNDCDGAILEDRDGDTSWDPARCPAEGDDCDDADATRRPGAAEVCDGADNDCDGTIADEPDSDGDTAVDESCAGGTDCDDEDPAVRPGIADVCNDLDDDCDGNPDEGYPCLRGDRVVCITSCGSWGSGRCTDECVAPAPSACRAPDEACGNYRDDDCDGAIDEDCGTADGGCTPNLEMCANLADDDCDGLTDTDDPECDRCPICRPNTFRNCHVEDPWGWGMQVCDDDGLGWGECVDDVAPPGCPAFGRLGWDASCCNMSGACCEDTLDADGDGDREDSFGFCSPPPPCP
ncbi:MAG: putative metal-binding motif-containing protein [Deltaproteobacteria bacterium]|nr:putative metal-binding motif-containing protein [Deltaproteobacteria bacterium]